MRRPSRQRNRRYPPPTLVPRHGRSSDLPDHDHDVSDLVVVVGVAMRLDNVAKRERAADHGPQLTALDERLEELEVVAYGLRRAGHEHGTPTDGQPETAQRRCADR